MIAVLCAISGALWRRAFGGWLSLSRVLLLASSVAAAGALAWARYGTDWRVAVIAACWAWLWSDGHTFDPPGKALFYRYVAPMAVCAAIVGVPWLALIGPGIFAAYWLAWRLDPKWRAGGFIDGPYAYAEMGAGSWAFGVLACAFAP